MKSPGVLALAFLACGPQEPDSPPANTNPAAAYVLPGTAVGTCLVRYNEALRTPSCCYSLGAGANTCDQNVACNARTGAGCCKIYSTVATTAGDGCCLYDGKAIGADRQAACAGLLAGR